MSVAYGYCRVSTPQQAEAGNGLEAQKAAIEQHYEMVLKPKGYTWGGHFIDPAVHGPVPFMDRPAGGELCQRVEKNDRIIVAKWDRAFRTMIDMCQTVQVWNARGVRCSVLDMPVDISTDEGMLIAQMFTAIAQFERARIRQRIREAMAIRRLQGKDVGGNSPIGFKWVKVNDKLRKLYPLEHDQKVMRKIVEWRLRGRSLDSIWRHLLQHQVRTAEGKEWSRSRINRAYHAGLRLMAEEMDASGPSLASGSPPEMPTSEPTAMPSPSTTDPAATT